MEFIQQSCYMISLSFLQNEPSRTVLNPLQSTYLFRRQTGYHRVAAIKAEGNQRED